MRRALTLLPLLAVVFTTAPLMIGCDRNDGPAERAGKSIDEAAEEVQDEIDDATDDR